MDVTITLMLDAEEFQTLRNEMRETDDRLRAEYNDMKRMAEDLNEAGAEPFMIEDRRRRADEARERLARVQNLVEELG